MAAIEADKAELLGQIERYFRVNREAWRAFVSEFVGVSLDLPLVALAKFFVIRMNQPFDMPTYMKTQADHIRQALESDLALVPAADRQRLVAEWLRTHAQSHRDQIILDQARHIDELAPALEPLLRDLLEGIGRPESR